MRHLITWFRCVTRTTDLDRQMDAIEKADIGEALVLYRKVIERRGWVTLAELSLYEIDEP